MPGRPRTVLSHGALQRRQALCRPFAQRIAGRFPDVFAWLAELIRDGQLICEDAEKGKLQSIAATSALSGAEISLWKHVVKRRSGLETRFR